MKTPTRLNLRRATVVLGVTLASALFSSVGFAADPSGESVTIRNDGDKTFYEFRVNGELVEIKVEPKVGKPYYLVPESQGDNFVRKDNPDIVVPKWVIFRW
ncbi:MULTISPECIES: DUF2782 domain-containing protein [unclassified Oceanobacter]|jgi:hypothetical protein|uniref:DUF2782 domain-containing protein n=1 Tax=unclassified Oceanobacter TaxID=2620260 RepID=UPI0027350D08|nr:MULTISPECIES: DUF2782 domain-containing protein [unclassified Oceanobacter]MDP2504477.1 DUF2782 domain-containing protein [Oceanobacter sp. 3_MG-2023]MDP2547069.1 DUF2782 domain-containing protein [Oceanobacter sp. 4_MG-2023]MDP2607893.1 DUF2782 domain-containing protein [Oceanobacter sp. 1_MG-2023]MDP2610923.1 DUF2782 domain-containing protein [Oceanobacter sp. 2_MG-2023]